MMPSLESLCEAGHLSTLDRQFALRMGRLGGESRPEALLAAALTRRETAAGHACLDLSGFDARDLVADAAEPPDVTRLREALADSPLVATPRQLAAAADASIRDARPLVLDAAGRVYLRRYWSYQTRLAAALRARAAADPPDVDAALLADGLDRMFGAADAAPRDVTPAAQQSFDFSAAARSPRLDRQRLAAAVAVARRFTVVSGGPGTGKTATAGKILALIGEQAFAANGATAPRMALVAPTGKAAAALGAAISSALETLTCDDAVKAAIPRSAVTIHRCLGVRGGPLAGFRHDADHPLPIDVLLVDEASMVDLALMTHLLAAVPGEARVILLGDEHQLASVEAGAVLGDICSTAEPPGYAADFAARLECWTGAPIPRAPGGDAGDVRNGIVRLTHSYRYDPERGIGALARAINRGDANAALEILEAEDHPEVVRCEFEGREEGFEREIVEGFAGFLRQRELAAMLARFADFRVLSPLRRGRGGVEELDRTIEAVLRRAGLVRGAGPSYGGRPLLVTANDYELELFNGDIGFVLPGDAGVAFPGGAGEARIVSAARLPACETAFAMTIHKSQGSEFDRVAIVISEAAARRASRELLYTAVTRARKRVTLYASRDAIAQAVERETRRSSGLGDALRVPQAGL